MGRNRNFKTKIKMANLTVTYELKDDLGTVISSGSTTFDLANRDITRDKGTQIVIDVSENKSIKHVGTRPKDRK